MDVATGRKNPGFTPEREASPTVSLNIIEITLLAVDFTIKDF
jgi:hypothetical protein